MTGAVDDLLAVEGRELGEHRTGEDIAALFAPVAEDSVVEQIDTDPAARGQERRIERVVAGERLAGLGEIDVPGQLGEGDGPANLAVRVEQRLTELAVAEAAAKTFGVLTLSVGVALFLMWSCYLLRNRAV